MAPVVGSPASHLVLVHPRVELLEAGSSSTRCELSAARSCASRPSSLVQRGLRPARRADTPGNVIFQCSLSNLELPDFTIAYIIEKKRNERLVELSRQCCQPSLVLSVLQAAQSIARSRADSRHRCLHCVTPREVPEQGALTRGHRNTGLSAGVVETANLENHATPLEVEKPRHRKVKGLTYLHTSGTNRKKEKAILLPGSCPGPQTVVHLIGYP